MKDRIQAIIDKKRLTAARFAEMIGVQRSSISHILSGRNNPSLDFLNKILVTFKDISGDWLITGDGDLLKQTSTNKAPIFRSESIPLQQTAFPLETSKTEDSFDKKNNANSPIQINPLPNNQTIENEKATGTPSISINSADSVFVMYSNGTFKEYIQQKS